MIRVEAFKCLANQMFGAFNSIERDLHCNSSTTGIAESLADLRGALLDRI